MSLDLRDCTFVGPAMPEPFVKLQLEDQLARKKLLPKAWGPEAKALQERWDVLRGKLRSLGETGGEARVRSHVLEPLGELLGWSHWDRAEDVVTREGAENGGYMLRGPPASDEGLAPHLRAWAVPLDAHLDAPSRRGRAYRYSPSQVARRVLLTRGERVALMTDGVELRILLSDPSARDSHVRIDLCGNDGWKRRKDVPDSFRLLKALCQPAGVSIVGDLLNEARLAQSSVTKKLREQARRAVEQFLQGILDDPTNAEARADWRDLNTISKLLWREGLVLVYRLLFILKLESSSDPARAFSFASTSLWRNSYSPSTALAPVAAEVRDRGAETGEFLASSLRVLFRLFSHGIQSSELNVSPLGGVLFGKEATPILDALHWSEQAVAQLLDALLWTPPDGRCGQRSGGRERVHYGTLDVEDLGRIYEALLELDPGITSEPMCRLRRAKLEVVVPVAQGAPYRKSVVSQHEESDDDQDDEHGESLGKGKTRVAFIEEIPAGRFYLRVGLGRKVTGSYYTPHAFVRFLVQETLGPQVEERSPQEDPMPLKILGLNVLDPAMGSGHFLVEACRFLGNALYEACRLCDELALRERELAESAKSEVEKRKHHARAAELWQRVGDLPDPNDELVAYLPSRNLDPDDGGLSQQKALALCRRLVAAHCLYGVDKNTLAVELAKVSLWLESYAEGLPLTFLDHRLICGDSLTGPFVEHLLAFPVSREPVETSMDAGLNERLRTAFSQALGHVRDLETCVGKDVADHELKRAARARLDEALAPFRLLAAAWTAGVMLGEARNDARYHAFVRAAADSGACDGEGLAGQLPDSMIDLGKGAISYDIAYPEVFHPGGEPDRISGFDAILGNPPWDAIKFNTKEFLAAFDLRVLEAPTKRERDEVELRLTEDSQTGQLFKSHIEAFEMQKRVNDRLYSHQKVTVNGDLAGRQLDAFRVFVERSWSLLAPTGRLGMVVPSAFHTSAGAVGVRRLIFESGGAEEYLVFKNSKRLFDISPGIEFGLLVGNRSARSKRGILRAKFGMTDLGSLDEHLLDRCLAIPTDALAVSNPFLTLPALDDPTALDVFLSTKANSVTFSNWQENTGVEIRSTPTSIHMTHESRFFRTWEREKWQDARRAVASEFVECTGAVPLHEGGTFHRYTDLWGDPPRYGLAASRVQQTDRWRLAFGHFRLAVRAIVGSSIEKSIAALLPPGTLVSNSALVEGPPGGRPTSMALTALAVLNAHVASWMLALSADLNINLFVLRQLPWPRTIPNVTLAHAALRLTCNHDSYAPLWHEQLGSAWRETTDKHAWPVLADDDTRWAVRAAIDAVVADAYGLDHDQYRHILACFSHTSYPKAPELCLAAFAELKQIGVDAFCKKHDPYWDIPLVTSLPKPVIDLPVGKGKQAQGFGARRTARST